MSINNKDNIIHTLETLKGFVNARLNKSASLSSAEKHQLLYRIVSAEPKQAMIPSPFVSRFNVFFKQKMQFALYALPIILLAFFANYSEALSARFKAWLTDFNNVKSEIALNQSSVDAKLSLSKAQKDIYALKASDNATQKDALATKVSSHSKDVRNKVAALVKENQIVEAKEIALGLEAALKADELFKVNPGVQEEVLAAIDLRVDLEKREVVQIALSPDENASSSTERLVALQAKIDALRLEIDGFAVNASSSDMIIAAKAALDKAIAYLADQDIERTVLSVQACERIVAELRLLLIQ